MDTSEAVNADPEKRYAAPGRDKSWIQSLEGRQVFPRELKPEQVGSIEEIAHALAGKFRFTCQTQKRYSVAEHCVRGSFLLPPAFAGAFLLHELSEVYLPDIAGPLKAFVFVKVPGDDGEGVKILWSELERLHTRAILEALDLLSIEPLIYSPEVKKLDWQMLAAEKRDLLGPEPESWHLPHPPPGDLVTIHPWSPDDAERLFLERFRELFGTEHENRRDNKLCADFKQLAARPTDDIPF